MTAAALTGDFPMPNRADLMSLQTINAKKDNTATTANKFTTVRNTSNNLHTGDIEGKSKLRLLAEGMNTSVHSSFGKSITSL